MIVSQFRPGDRVVITAKDDFFAFVDGWPGVVKGHNNGLVHIECDRGEEGVKTFFVPADQVAYRLV